MPSRLLARAAVACALISCWPGSPAQAHDDDAAQRAALETGHATGSEPERWLLLADLYRRAGDFRAAEDAVARAASLAPAADGVALTRAAIALDRGESAAARAALAPLLERDPAASEAQWLEARARLAQRDTAGALAAMDRSLAAQAPAHVRALAPDRVLRRAELAIASGDATRALDGLLAAIGGTEASPALVERAFDLVRSGVKPSAGRAAFASVTVRAARAEPLASAATQALLRRGPYLQSVAPTELVVRWRTDVPASSRVRIGIVPGALDSVFADTAQVTEHIVPVTGLAPATRYWYAIGSDAGDLLGDSTTTFRTPAAAGTAEPVRLWIVGDSGSDNVGSRAVRDGFARWSAARPPDLWLMLGDNAYGAGTDLEYQTGLFNLYASALRRWPLWPTRGNHDILYAGPANDYYDHFTLPTGGEAGGVPSGTEAYYAFDWGPIHFVCLDSEGSDRSIGGPMLRWLRDDLASTAQSWIVAFWHHPPYSKGSHDSDNAIDSGGRMRDMRQNALPVLDSAGVDIVLTGHSHAYERSKLLRGHYGVSSTLAPAMILDAGDGRVDGNGPYAKPTLVHGAQEGIVYTVNGSAAQVSGGSLNHPAMVTSMNAMGSMAIDIEGNRLDARFLDSLGVVRDSFTILKGGALGVPPPARRPSLVLDAPRPSPFASSTTLSFVLPRAGDAQLDVFDAAGRTVAHLARGPFAAGRHAVTWQGLDDGGRAAPPGLYFVLLRQGESESVRRIVRLP